MVPNHPSQWSIERSHPRYSFDISISVVTPEPERSHLRGRFVDISLGGASARLPADLSAGQIVQMEFHLPGEKELTRLRAIVRNRLITRYGFEFLSPTGEQLVQLNRICSILETGSSVQH